MRLPRMACEKGIESSVDGDYGTKWVWFLVGWGMMILALGKGERVTTGGRGEIGGEAGEVTGVVANAPAMDSLGKRYETFSGWGMAAGKVEILLAVGGGLMWTEVWKPDLNYKKLHLTSTFHCMKVNIASS